MIFCDYAAYAQGNLLITPRRVVFEGSKRIQELNLANIGKDTSRYVLSVVEIRMNEDGTFDNITEPDSGQSFASPYLRFFPRSVVLAPNESQLVKVQLTRTSQLAPGEYRSHAYFRGVPNEKPLGEPGTAGDSGSIAVNLIPVFGITIPVIIRVGELHASVVMTELTYEKHDTLHTVSMVFNREGNKSVYGDIRVEHINATGEVTKVGMANGVAVYTPNIRRRFAMVLQTPGKVDFSKGRLRAVFVAHSDTEQGVLTQSEIELDQ